MKQCPPKVAVTEITELFNGYSMIEEITYSQTDHQGNMSGEISREVFSKGDAVAIVPYEPTSDVVWLVRQVRPAALLAKCEPNQWEIPAGLISNGETADVAAVRELAEETSITNAELRYLCNFFPSPGNSKDRVFLYAAIVGGETLLSGNAGVESESEFIDFSSFSLDEAIDLVQKNVIQNSTTMLGIMWLEKYKFHLI